MSIEEALNGNHIHGYLMRRQRIVFEGAIYHVTQRAPGREVIFLEEADYLYFLKTLKEKTKHFNFNIFCFALLSNHVHLLIQTSQKNLSQSMRSTFQCYAQYFNKKYLRKGHVFCGRFRAALCYEASYVIAASVYIHLNPLRAGLGRYLGDYRWSSVNLYTTRPRSSFVASEKFLSFLEEDPQKARQTYSHLLQNILSKSNTKEEALLDTRMIWRAVRKYTDIVKELLRGQEEDGLDELIQRLKTSRANTPTDYKARQYVVEQLLAQGYNFKEIQYRLGISRVTLYRTMKKVS